MEDTWMTPRHWTLMAWGLFTLSGLFFLSDAIESGDKTALASAFTWLSGVVFFLRAMAIEEQ